MGELKLKQSTSNNNADADVSDEGIEEVGAGSDDYIEDVDMTMVV